MFRNAYLDDRDWMPGWRPVNYVDDGMEVWIAWPRHTGTAAVRCKVACPAGHYARVVNEARGIDTWVHLSELRLQPLPTPKEADAAG